MVSAKCRPSGVSACRPILAGSTRSWTSQSADLSDLAHVRVVCLLAHTCGHTIGQKQSWEVLSQATATGWLASFTTEMPLTAVVQSSHRCRTSRRSALKAVAVV